MRSWYWAAIHTAASWALRGCRWFRRCLNICGAGTVRGLPGCMSILATAAGSLSVWAVSRRLPSLRCAEGNMATAWKYCSICMACFINIESSLYSNKKSSRCVLLETYLLLLLLHFLYLTFFRIEVTAAGGSKRKNDIQFYSERGKTIKLKVAKQYTTI